MDLGLRGRTAIVFGASPGIGLEIAEALAAEGANVAIFARRREPLEREAERLGAVAVRGDPTAPEDLSRLVEQTVGAFGGIDILVLNGGGPPSGQAAGPADEAAEGAVEPLLLSAVGLTDLCLPYLEASGRGRIVNIESSSAPAPIDGPALSNTLRPEVVDWMKGLAREVGPKGITVNTIAPGRSPDPAQIRAVACFLASDRASYLTGAVVPLDGGPTRDLP